MVQQLRRLKGDKSTVFIRQVEGLLLSIRGSTGGSVSYSSKHGWKSSGLAPPSIRDSIARTPISYNCNTLSESNRLYKV